jgi:hypothetical protein
MIYSCVVAAEAELLVLKKLKDGGDGRRSV